jgi:hypothetical protein
LPANTASTILPSSSVVGGCAKIPAIDDDRRSAFDVELLGESLACFNRLENISGGPAPNLTHTQKAAWVRIWPDELS